MSEILKVVLAADIIISDDQNNIVLIKRKNDPYKDQWALPGGIMDEGETIGQTAVREAKEETGLDIELDNLIGVYSDPFRDPRERNVSVLFSASIKGGELKAGDDAKEIQWMNLNSEIDLAFDHNQMLKDYIRQKK